MSELKNCPFCGGDCCEMQYPQVTSNYKTETKYSAGCPNCGVWTDYCDTEEQAITAWNRRADRWISVSDGEPYEKSCHYLVLSKMNMAHGGTWESNDGDARKNMSVAYFDCTGAFNVPYVTHWMPLPESPEGVN